jgi:hypothetical protein
MISINKIIKLKIKFFQSYERSSKDLKRPQKPIYKDQKSRISKTTKDYKSQLPNKFMDQRLLMKSLLKANQGPTNAHFEDGLEPT